MSIAPSLLCPSADKVDLERLLQEIPKYQPWVSPLAFEQWGLFADEASTLLTTVNPDVLWDLPILQVASNSRPATSSTDNQLSDETRALLEKQSRIPKLVTTYFVCNGCFVGQSDLPDMYVHPSLRAAGLRAWMYMSGNHEST